MVAISRKRSIADESHANRSELILLGIAGGFVVLNAIALGLLRNGSLNWSDLAIPAIWSAVLGLAYFVLVRYAPHVDLTI